MASSKKGAGGTRPRIASSHGGAKKSASPGATGSRKPRPDKGSSGPARSATPRAKKPRPNPGPKKAAPPRSRAVARAQPPPPHAEQESRPVREASKNLALTIANAALDKKALDVQIVDVVGNVDYTDYLVLMSGRSDRHVLAVADAIEDALVKMTPKRKPVTVEGRNGGNWVVLDFQDVVAHVFQEEARSFYDLDTLWNDARKIPVAADAPARSAPVESGDAD